jgi:hypothetical protein
MVYKSWIKKKLRNISELTPIIGMYKYNRKMEVDLKITSISKFKKQKKSQSDVVN